ncbi:MAG TPA: MBL fold metallo-hydrolase [Methylomirabilota bacterium]|nr:MBL fold metallo-hydrolase [Methylomirabilota bacterium]
MKISKHLHSCLLVEEGTTTILIDPGIFTYQKQALSVASIAKLTTILITHEHPDHFHIPFIKELLAKFPQVQIVSNLSVVTLLEKENIKASIQGNDVVKVIKTNHERVFDKLAPEHVMFEIFGRLCHPGDSMSFSTKQEIVALPLMGPSWMITQAVEKALALKPKVIIPIHDWQWRDEARKEFYKRLQDFFTQNMIQFKEFESGIIVEV